MLESASISLQLPCVKFSIVKRAKKQTINSPKVQNIPTSAKTIPLYLTGIDSAKYVKLIGKAKPTKVPKQVRNIIKHIKLGEKEDIKAKININPELILIVVFLPYLSAN